MQVNHLAGSSPRKGELEVGLGIEVGSLTCPWLCRSEDTDGAPAGLPSLGPHLGTSVEQPRPGRAHIPQKAKDQGLLPTSWPPPTRAEAWPGPCPFPPGVAGGHRDTPLCTHPHSGLNVCSSTSPGIIKPSAVETQPVTWPAQPANLGTSPLIPFVFLI